MNISQILLCIFLPMLSFIQNVRAQEREYDKLLLGTHLFSLQWISLEHFGKVEIKRKGNVYAIKGKQISKEKTEYIEIDGTLKPLSPSHLEFNGIITTQVNFFGSNPCIRKGIFNFKRTGTRKYWRLQEMDSPCNFGTDYIDIYPK